MRDYAKLADGLLYCSNPDNEKTCRYCPLSDECTDIDKTVERAAVAIEELLAAVPKWISVEEQDGKV